jgi:hypothetical protein
LKSTDVILIKIHSATDLVWLSVSPDDKIRAVVSGGKGAYEALSDILGPGNTEDHIPQIRDVSVERGFRLNVRPWPARFIRLLGFYKSIGFSIRGTIGAAWTTAKRG